MSHESSFELFSMQNSQNFLGFCPWTPLGRAYSAPQILQLQNCFSPRYTHQKIGILQKLLATALAHLFLQENLDTPLP